MLCQNGLQQEIETFQLLKSMYMASRNVSFVHLWLDLIPWQSIDKERLLYFEIKITKTGQ